MGSVCVAIDVVCFGFLLVVGCVDSLIIVCSVHVLVPRN